MSIARVGTLMLAAAIVAGCHGESVTPPALPASATAAAPRASWKLPKTSEQVLWSLAGDAYAYTLDGTQVAVIGGFNNADGICTDPTGDVYITDSDLVYAYAPGASLPFYIYDDTGQQASSCAFDPATGNLAVANSANLTIFPPASGTPIAFTTPNMTSYSYLNFDKTGNLYVDGYGAKNSFQLAELPKGSGSLVSVKLPGINNRTHRPGGLVWDGQDVAISDGLNDVIYRISISGSSGTVLNSYHIPNWRRHFTPVFAILGKRLFFPIDGKVEFFSWPPKGGRAKNGFFGHIGSLTIGPEVIN
ncbi:MAG: hypothetical protein WA814_02995 [Candidatus Baltobacteraceae bacterium]